MHCPVIATARFVARGLDLLKALVKVKFALKQATNAHREGVEVQLEGMVGERHAQAALPPGENAGT
jgi:hypothetical protein